MSEVEISNTSSEPPRSSEDSVYPYNDVKKTISGHTFEVDDTLGAERIKTEHCSGTYDEVIADGSKTVVVVGKGHYTIHNGADITVVGKCNITVKGECNQIIEGDYNVTVHGDHNLTVKGNRRTRIDKSDLVETVGDYSYNCGQNHQMRVDDDSNLFVGGNNVDTVIGTRVTTIGKQHTINSLDSRIDVIQGMFVCTSTESTSIASDVINFSSSDATNMHAENHFNVVRGDINLTDNLDVEGIGEIKGDLTVEEGAITAAAGPITASTKDVSGFGPFGAVSLTGHVHIETGGTTLVPTGSTGSPPEPEP